MILAQDFFVERMIQKRYNFGNISGKAEMHQEYIDGKKEIREINMEFNARYIKGNMDKENGRSCVM